LHYVSHSVDLFQCSSAAKHACNFCASPIVIHFVTFPELIVHSASLGTLCR